MSAPLVYLILGCSGTDRFSVVADLIDFGSEKDETSKVFYSSADSAEVETSFSVRSREATAEAYAFSESKLSLEPGDDADLIFVVAGGHENPADFVESFHGWLAESGCELGRVITILHSELAIDKKKAFHWFDCCIHFSDVVLLAKRENVSNKQLKELLDHYEEECFPCLFEYVKKGRVSNPKLVLETQPRRISRIFEEPEVFEDDEEEDLLDEALAGDLTKDPFLKRVSGGRRAVQLPKISDFL